MRAALFWAIFFIILTILTFKIFILPAIMFICDVHGRYKDYLGYKKSNLRIDILLKKARDTQCQRDCLLMATKHKNLVKAYYKSIGIRFYHVLPLWFFKRPDLLLRKSFWKSLLLGG